MVESFEWVSLLEPLTRHIHLIRRIVSYPWILFFTVNFKILFQLILWRILINLMMSNAGTEHYYLLQKEYFFHLILCFFDSTIRLLQTIIFQRNSPKVLHSAYLLKQLMSSFVILYNEYFERLRGASFGREKYQKSLNILKAVWKSIKNYFQLIK